MPLKSINLMIFKTLLVKLQRPMFKTPQLFPILISCILCLNFSTSSAQVNAPVLPPGIYSYTYQNPDADAQNHFLLTPFKVTVNDSQPAGPKLLTGMAIWFGF